MTIPLLPDGPPTHYHEQWACDKNHEPGTEPLDPVRLAIERDGAWELMKHYQRLKDNAQRTCNREMTSRRQHEIKARAFDRLRALTRRGMLDPLEAERIINSAFDSWKLLVEADTKKAAK